MDKFIAIILFFISLNLNAQIAQLDFDELDGVSQIKEKVTNVIFDVKNNFSKPERITGIKGNALRLDGWSTWANNTSPLTTFKNINKISVECWYATESFTSQRSAIISQDNNSSGFGIEIGPTGTIYAYFYLDGSKQELYSLIPITKYKWNLIALTVNVENGEAFLYLNGRNVGTKAFNKSDRYLNLASDNLFIGRSARLNYFDVFPLNVLNGAIDELMIFDTIKNENYYLDKYNENSNLIPDLEIDAKKRFQGDYLRPIFHAIPNSAWTNESYGLIYFNQKYHLFFQKNPNGPYLYFMHWGHLSSSDLINWKEEKIALAPGANLESFGIWSGCSILDKTGFPQFFYTGVNGNWASINKAISIDSSLIELKKSDLNPIIDRAPSKYPNIDFRDPFIFETNGYYYMIIGSGKPSNKGGMLISYKSKDLENWELIEPIYEQTESGIFWEMPSIIKFDDSNFMLSVTPVPTASSPAQTIYWMGNFKNDKFIPYSKKPLNFELINGNLLSPSFGIDKNKNHIYLGIIPEERDVTAQIKSGWRNVFSLPRTVRLLQDSTVGQIPHPNLCALRSNYTTLKTGTLKQGSSNNLNVSGTRLELEFNIQADSASIFSILLFKNSTNGEQTKLNFDLQKNTIELDRTASSILYPIKKILISDYVMNHKEVINVRLFLDGSILEVFIDKIVVFSARVYPSSPESNKVDILPTYGNLKIISSNAWEMKPGNETSYCLPDSSELPTKLRQNKIKVLVLANKEEKENMFSIFPNPAKNTLKFNTNFTGEYSLTGYDSYGREFDCSQFKLTGTFDLSTFPPGHYFFQIIASNEQRIFKIIKNE